MSPRLSVGADAEADIAEAALWYDEQAMGLGAEYLRAVDVALAEIRRTPERYPQVRGDCRRALLRRFPYAIYYVPSAEVIHVIACMHARRDPGRWQSRVDG